MAPRGPLPRRKVTAGALALAWLAVTIGSWAWLFTHSREQVVVASHDVVPPLDLDGGP